MLSGGFFYLTNEPISSIDCFVNCEYQQGNKSTGNKNHLSQIFQDSYFKKLKL